MNITKLTQHLNTTESNELMGDNESLLVAKSIALVIDDMLPRLAPVLVLTLSCYRGLSCEFYNDLIEKLYINWGTQSLQMIRLTMHKTLYVTGHRMVNLILIDSYESLEAIDVISYTKHYNTNEYYYILLQTTDFVVPFDMQRVFEYCWKHLLINCNVQIQTSQGEIQTYTYYPFTLSGCRVSKPTLINRYLNGHWENKIIFPKKLSNLHGCPLAVATWHVPPFIYLELHDDGRLSLNNGLDGRLVHHLAQRMNFSIEIKVPPNNEQRGIVSGDKITGALLMLHNQDADLSLGFYRHSEDRMRFVSATIGYYHTNQVIAMPRNAFKFSSIEILLYPFPNLVWLLVILICLFSVMLIYLVNRYHHLYPQLFPDYFNRNSYINILLLALGMPIDDIPARDFARLLITDWMLFTLVLRTIYQSLLFHLIRVQVNRSIPQTLGQLIEDKYSVAMVAAAEVSLRNVQLLKRLNSIVLNDMDDAAAFSYIDYHWRPRLAAAGPVDFLRYYITEKKKNGVFSIMPQDLVGLQLTIYMTKHSFLINQFDEEILWIYSFGLINAWLRKEHDFTYIKSATHLQHEVFGLEELQMVFLVGCFGSILATFVFILEMLSCKSSQLRKFFEWINT